MQNPSMIHSLQTALDELDTAQNTLQDVLENAHHSSVHSTYTAALNRILAFNNQTINSLQNLVTILNRHAHQTQP